MNMGLRMRELLPSPVCRFAALRSFVAVLLTISPALVAAQNREYSASVVTVLDNTLNQVLGELSFPIPINPDTGNHMSQNVQLALGDVTGDGNFEICIAVIAARIKAP